MPNPNASTSCQAGQESERERVWRSVATAPRCVASSEHDNGRRPVIVTRFPFTGTFAPMAIARLTTSGWISGKRGTRLWFEPTHWTPFPPMPSPENADA